MSNWYNRFRAGAVAVVAGLLLAACDSRPADQTTAVAPAAKSEYDIGWSIYAGWMPWPYAQQAGIVKKWEDKYGLKINIVQVNDYVESVNQFTAGKLDGVTVANMDALTIPAAGGKDTTAVIVGDYSNGNDGIVLKGGKTLADIKGRTVNLVELSVSHYLLARALDTLGMKLADIKTVNTSDADIAGAFATPEVTTVVTWNPQLAEVKKAPGAAEVFSSANIPGEILDLLVVDTALLKANPNLGKALAGIWYDTMAVMAKQDEEGKKARAAMATLAGAAPEEFEGQVKTTFLYYTPKDAVAATSSPALVETMDKVRKFSFDKGLYGPGATSVDAIGMTFPGGKTLGAQTNIKLRFDPTWMQAAADGDW